MKQIIFFIYIAASTMMFSQQKLTASFETVEGKVLINYEFQGENDKEYEVKAVLKRTSASTYTYIPKTLTGDIGKGKFANKKLSIVWALSKNEEETLQDNDYYFEITAYQVKGGIPWYYYVGTALAGGGAAAVLLLKKKTDETPAATTALPPERP